MNKKDYLIFPGSASKKLAKKMSGFLGSPLGNTEVSKFNNSEFKVRILSSVKNKNCIIVQTTSNPASDNLLELFFMIDTIKKAGAKKIIVVIPYFSYSRQHVDFRLGECISTDIIFKIISTLGAGRIITLDFHNLESLESAPLPVINISALPFIAKEMEEKIGISNVVIVSPDEGGECRAQVFSDSFLSGEGRKVIVMKKKRDYNKIHMIKREKNFADKRNIKGKIAIIVDDICTTGKTLLSAVETCAKSGAKKIYAVIVHADMDESIVSLINKSPLEKLFITNSIEKAGNITKCSPKIEIIDISKALVVELQH